MSTTSVFGDRTRPQMMKGLIMFGTSLCLHSSTEAAADDKEQHSSTSQMAVIHHQNYYIPDIVY